jgi:hypothetical protein
MMEPITVILQTFKRTDYAVRTIAAAHELLRYDGELRWYVADDGSSIEHIAMVMGALDQPPAGLHSGRQGYGGNANTAWRSAKSALTFWLEDDFELTQPLDLTPHAYALMESEQLGMVRLGYINGEMLEPAQEFAQRRYHTLPRAWPDTSFMPLPGIHHSGTSAITMPMATTRPG